MKGSARARARARARKVVPSMNPDKELENRHARDKPVSIMRIGFGRKKRKGKEGKRHSSGGKRY